MDALESLKRNAFFIKHYYDMAVNSLSDKKGDSGEKGQDGVESDSIFNLWKEIPGNETKTICEFYRYWYDIPENITDWEIYTENKKSLAFEYNNVTDLTYSHMNDRGYFNKIVGELGNVTTMAKTFYNSSVEDISNVDFSNVTNNISGCFQFSDLKQAENITLVAENQENVFSDTKIYGMKYISNSGKSDIYNTVGSQYTIKLLDNFGESNKLYIQNHEALESVVIEGNLKNCRDVNLSNCTKLSDDSIYNIIELLPVATSDTSYTINVTNVLNWNDRHEKIMTAKGWQIIKFSF